MNKLETARQLAKQTAEQKPSKANLPPDSQTNSEQTKQELINFIQATQKILDITTQNQQVLTGLEKKMEEQKKQVRTLKSYLVILIVLATIGITISILT